MATEKKMEKSPAEKAVLMRRIVCIVLVLFGAFMCWFGYNAWANGQAIVKAVYADAETSVEATKLMAQVSTYGLFLAAAGLMKIAIAVLAWIEKGKKSALPVLTIVNLGIAIIGLTMLGGVNAAFLWVLIADFVISGVAAILLSERLVRYLREMLGELKKLTWLSGKELFSHTLAVVTFVVVMAAVIYLLDTSFSAGFKLIGKINIG